MKLACFRQFSPIFVVGSLVIVLSGCPAEPDPSKPEPTPTDRLFDLMQLTDLHADLQALQEIADNHGGHRAWTSPGYQQSADYFQQQLEDAGWITTIDAQQVEDWMLNTATLAQTSPSAQSFSLHGVGLFGFEVLYGSSSGSASGFLEAVDLMLPPSPTPNTSTSGCEVGDWNSFTPGAIALLQRGGCTFLEKAQRANQAGASAVIIFNEGQPGRTDPFEGYLEPDLAPAIPIVSISFAQGDTLAEQLSLEPVSFSVTVDAGLALIPLENVLAELPGESDLPAILIGAHLDSVTSGPGINDNGSGSALVVAIARAVAAFPGPRQRTLRIALWDGEESGLLGSREYVAQQTADQLSSWTLLDAYLNFDMVASPNGVPFVYDGDGTANDMFSIGSHAGSDQLEALFRDAYRSMGIMPLEVGLGLPSDSWSFVQANIPSGGIYTGADEVVNAEEAELFGAIQGEAMDACYHQPCDIYTGLNLDLLDEAAEAATFVIESLLLDDTLLN